MNVLVWHVHGSWMTSFVHGRHRYLIPKLDAGAPWGLGRAGRPWPSNAIEVTPPDLADMKVDVVVLQRIEEIDLVTEWLGRRPGRGIPAVFVEHNAPREHAAATRHPLSDRTDIPLIHVTHFNQLMWDNGRCPTVVIEHGVVDPGHRYTGEFERAATMINEPIRRARVTGSDLLPTLSAAAPIDVYGIGTSQFAVTDRVVGRGDLPTQRLHGEVARRRVYVHTARWTSLGLSLIEAMYLGMPVVAVASTAAPTTVVEEAGVVSADPEVLAAAIRRYVAEPGLAAIAGKSARAAAHTKFGLEKFLHKWDRILEEAVR
ncbi:glycosyltransferase family 4 protein [Skermania sp. ID1734]|nr:glycosyltransferase family 4 protein [Skermania sp. ID1734]